MPWYNVIWKHFRSASSSVLQRSAEARTCLASWQKSWRNRTLGESPFAVKNIKWYLPPLSSSFCLPLSLSLPPYLSLSFSETGPCYGVLPGLKLREICLPLTLECWDQRCVLPFLAKFLFFWMIFPRSLSFLLPFYHTAFILNWESFWEDTWS